MNNIEMVTSENILVIKIDLSKRIKKSASGKSTIVATTEGNKKIDGFENIRIGVNCYAVE
jgi:hypothetical protein